MAMIRHVILDRDGVLNFEAGERGWVEDWSQWQWIPAALDGLRALTRAGIAISVATNQSCIGRGCVSRDQVDAIHARMIADAERHGARIGHVYVCPHAPEDRCTCRKPAPGLLAAAVAASGVPHAQTVMVGDDARDLYAARDAGIDAVLVRSGKGPATEEALRVPTPKVFGDLLQFARALIEVPATGKDSVTNIERMFAEHEAVMSAAAAALPAVLSDVVDLIDYCLERGNKVLACGNGGSAAAAQHLVAELVCRFRHERRALAAAALASDVATLTAIGNDYGYDRVFARQVEAVGATGDVLVAFSTSGNSANVVAAAETARRAGCKVVALTGEDGGKLAAHATIVVRAPSRVVARIQEVHDVCIHAIAGGLEERLVGRVRE